MEHEAPHRSNAFAVIHLRATAEGGEVVLADERVARQVHGPQLQRLGDVPGRARHERVVLTRIEHVVPVQPRAGAVASVELWVGGPLPVTNGDLGPTHAVHPALQTAEVGVIGQVAAHHLAPGMNACIGAPSADEVGGLTHHALDRGS
jgi:hypothetical protein